MPEDTPSNPLPNAFIVGTTKIEMDEDQYEEFENLIIIQAKNPEQIREALKTGKIEFTVFGEPA